MARLVYAIASVALLLVTPPALGAPAATKPPPVAAAPRAEAPPYESQLLRLAEILGAVHYLSQLCGSSESDVWRDQMQKLLESEDPDDVWRARMVDRFNRGYESYKSVYLSCTAAAGEASARYLDEGARLAAEITARYGR